MPRGRGGMKAPVQPEDGSSVGIHRLKRVADFGPPTVGTLPVRNKKPKRGRGGGPPAASGSSDSGRGSWGSSSNRGSAPRGRGGGGGGRGRGRGSPSDGGRSWRASSPYDKGKGRDEGWGGRREDEYRGGSGSGSGSSRYDRSRDRDRDRERPGRDYGRSYDRDYDRNYDRDRRDRDRRRDDAREDNVDKEEMYANQPPLHPSLPPRSVSTHTRWDSSPIAYQHPPSLPAGGISESESVVELLSSSPQGSALHLDDVAPPVAGPSRPVASGSGSRQPDAPADAPQPKPPKFTPRNHNARANEPQPPPPPPKEPTPPPPEPPKFKPKNHNQRRNDPTPQSRPAPAPPAQPAARRPSPPASHRILTSPELPTWLEPQLPQFRQPPQQPQPQRHRSKSRQQSQPPAPAPAPPPPKSKSPVIPTYVPSTSDEEPEPEDIKPDITALAEAKLAALETEPPPRTRSPQREGVLWIKPEEIPADCLGSGVGPKRAERMAARKAFVVAQRRKLLQAGKVVVSSKWRSDGLAIDWRLKEYIPPETNESSDDDDFIEVVPPPKQPTPEHIVVEDDTPSPPAHAPAPLPPAAALVPPGPPAPVVPPEPDLSQPGVTTIPLPPRYTMAAARKTPAFAVWVDNQLEKFRAAPVTVEHTTTFNGLRIRWEPVEEPEGVAGPVPSVQESVAPAPIAQSDAPPAPSSNTVTQLLSSLAEPNRAPGTIAEPLLNSNQPDAVAGSTILPAAVATVDPLFAQPAASTPALIPSSPLDFSTLGLGLPPSFPSLSSSPARPSDTTTSQVTNAVQWLDTSALERAVAEATSAVGLNPSPPKPPPPPVPTGSALGLIPPSDDIPLSSTTTPAAPLLNPSPPAALASKSPVEPTASPVTLPDAAAAAPSAADRLAQLQTQLNGLFDRIDRWMRLQEDFPDRAEQLQRQIERTELSIFEVQNQMDVEKRRMEAERAPPA